MTIQLSPAQQTARKLGANCDACPLKCKQPVLPPQVVNPVHKSLAAVAETPAKQEVKENQFLVGPTGQLFNDRILGALNIQRKEVHLSNGLLCWPDEHLSSKEWKQALNACRPRLERELKAVKPNAVLGFGKKALYSLANRHDLGSTMGAPMETQWGHPLIVTFHPAMLFRQKMAYLPVLRIHAQRAWELAKGTLKPWKWKRHVTKAPYGPALKQILREKLPTSVDIETGGLSAFKSRIRVIGFANKNISVSLPWGVEEELVKAILTDPKIPKVGQNFLYDRVALLYQHGIKLKGELHDTLALHSILAPELKHDLAFQACIEFHAPRWKDIFKAGAGDVKGSEAWDKRPIEDVQAYNAKDNELQIRLFERHMKRLKEVHRGAEIYKEARLLAEIALKMTYRGLKIDMERRAFHQRTLTARWKNYRRRLRYIANQTGWVSPNGKPFNPWSKDHLAHFFFKHLGVQVTARSKKTGAPRLDEGVLARLAQDPSQIVALSAKLIINARKWRSMCSAQVSHIGGQENQNLVGDVAHPFWRPGGSKSGRWTGKDPNPINITKAVETLRKKWHKKKGGTYKIHGGLRDLYTVHNPESWIIEADYAAQEVRMMAYKSLDPVLIERVEGTESIHNLNARDYFNIPKSSPVSGQQKLLAKSCFFLTLYEGKALKMWETIAPMAPGATIKHCKAFIRKTYKTYKGMRQFQLDSFDLAEQNGYTEDELSGRRVYFWDKVEGPKAVNPRIQPACAKVINNALLRVDKRIDWKKTFISMQYHDALIGETDDPAKFTKILIEEMEKPVVINGVKRKFPVELKIGKNWGRMKSFDPSNLKEVMCEVEAMEAKRKAKLISRNGFAGSQNLGEATKQSGPSQPVSKSISGCGPSPLKPTQSVSKSVKTSAGSVKKNGVPKKN